MFAAAAAAFSSDIRFKDASFVFLLNYDMRFSSFSSVYVCKGFSLGSLENRLMSWRILKFFFSLVFVLSDLMISSFFLLLLILHILCCSGFFSRLIMFILRSFYGCFLLYFSLCWQVIIKDLQWCHLHSIMLPHHLGESLVSSRDGNSFGTC